MRFIEDAASASAVVAATPVLAFFALGPRAGIAVDDEHAEDEDDDDAAAAD